MRKVLFTTAVLSLLVLLVGCLQSPPPPPVQEPVVEAEPEPQTPRETRNVFYKGIVRPAGISIYMEGSHKLELEEGRFILLESDDVDLNGYVGERVEAFGSIRPTVEAGAMIMRVEKMRLMVGDAKNTDDAEGSEEKDAEDAEDTEEANVDETEKTEEEEPTEDPVEVEAATSSEASEASASSSSVSSEAVIESSSSSSSSEASSKPATSAPDANFVEKTEVMASHDTSIGNWSQKYCSGHIGFCALVHKNWWFISFGATTSSLWHIEYSPEPIEGHGMGDGPIRIQLFSGTVGMKKAIDKQVKTVGGNVIGYREWSDSRHFEVTAPAALKDAVQLIVNTIEEYEE